MLHVLRTYIFLFLKQNLQYLLGQYKMLNKQIIFQNIHFRNARFKILSCCQIIIYRIFKIFKYICEKFHNFFIIFKYSLYCHIFIILNILYRKKIILHISWKFKELNLFFGHSLSYQNRFEICKIILGNYSFD